MKHSVRLILVVCCCVLALVYLKALKHGPRSAECLAGQELLRKAEDLAVPGMSKAELLSVLGHPAQEQTFDNGLSFAFYWFPSPIPADHPNENVIGIQVRFSNQTVICLEKIYAVSYGNGSGKANRSRVKRNPQFDVQPAKQKSCISFYVVKDTKFENARLVAVPELQLEGYTRQETDLKLSSIESVEEVVAATTAQSNKGAVLIRLSESDARLFGVLTRENVGDRLLIAVDDEPLHAPVISSEIRDGNFHMTGLTGEQVRRLREKLDALVRK